MPAITSPFSALRFSGRLMAIQNACPRFSVMTPVVSVMARSLPYSSLSHLRQLGSQVQGQSAGRRRLSASTQICSRSKCERASGRNCLLDPDLVVVERGTTDRSDGFGACQHIDAAATDMILIRMNGLGDQHAAPHALEQCCNQCGLAARIVERHGVAVRNV